MLKVKSLHFVIALWLLGLTGCVDHSIWGVIGVRSGSAPSLKSQSQVYIASQGSLSIQSVVPVNNYSTDFTGGFSAYLKRTPTSLAEELQLPTGLRPFADRFHGVQLDQAQYIVLQDDATSQFVVMKIDMSQTPAQITEIGRDITTNNYSIYSLVALNQKIYVYREEYGSNTSIYEVDSQGLTKICDSCPITNTALWKDSSTGIVYLYTFDEGTSTLSLLNLKGEVLETFQTQGAIPIRNSAANQELFLGDPTGTSFTIYRLVRTTTLSKISYATVAGYNGLTIADVEISPQSLLSLRRNTDDAWDYQVYSLLTKRALGEFRFEYPDSANGFSIVGGKLVASNWTGYSQSWDLSTKTPIVDPGTKISFTADYVVALEQKGSAGTVAYKVYDSDYLINLDLPSPNTTFSNYGLDPTLVEMVMSSKSGTMYYFTFCFLAGAATGFDYGYALIVYDSVTQQWKILSKPNGHNRPIPE